MASVRGSDRGEDSGIQVSHTRRPLSHPWHCVTMLEQPLVEVVAIG